MRFLVDENLSPQFCEHLASRGYAAEHVRSAVGAGATDQEVFAYASQVDTVVITADTDFGAILARTKATKPSVLLVRELLSLPAVEQGGLLVANLEQLRAVLSDGAIVVFTLTDLRVRPLPIGG